MINEDNSEYIISNKNKLSDIRLKKQLSDKKKELNKIVCVTDSLYMDWRCGDITRADILE
jgi:hypothetical protein